MYHTRDLQWINANIVKAMVRIWVQGWWQDGTLKKLMRQAEFYNVFNKKDLFFMLRKKSAEVILVLLIKMNKRKNYSNMIG